ncbi:phosphate ABC transporter substrate-binding protein [Vibrio mexicanus]|uniref:phosphate ABC transporter substrate-binding protein n=1 Tax=Vibrio mexicanus TaxID=1004326 RepID=UPI00063C34F7|nr:phosphate ABC transporter substrate-binding protein [Vibrio mexicanus]
MFRAAVTALLSATILSSPAIASEVSVSGSTSVSRVMEVLAEDFNNDHPDTYVAVQSVGSTAGITLLKKGVVDIGMSSRYLTEREQDESISTKTIALDGLAVVVNPENNVANVTREQLFDIYKGKITNWKELGGADQKIAVVTREASSGSRYSFESLLGLTKIVNDRMVSDISHDNLVVNSNSMVKTIVNHNKQAIGFISTGSVDRSVKAINFEGVAPTNESIASRKYELSRPFILLYHTEELDEKATEFLNYVTTNKAAALITEYGYTPAK